ncbi:MAG: pilus assembly PilX N-terminal domain-containing protein [Deltaproteobacteria bacterium]|nr:pilus assembly PilX N-terminal domain-containing protein [Deltaproteobacteria bacterium]
MVNRWARNGNKACRGDSGSVLMITMVVMVCLALVGMAATTTTTIELGVAGNDEVYRENLSRAEGAANVCSQWLDGLQEDLEILIDRGDYTYLVKKSELPYGDIDITCPVYWESNGDDTPPSRATIDTNARCLVVYEHSAKGNLIAGGVVKSVDQITIYGQSKYKGGKVIIQIGHKERRK